MEFAQLLRLNADQNPMVLAIKTSILDLTRNCYALQSDRPPIYGLSLTDMVSADLGIVDIGAGVMFDNFYTDYSNQVSTSKEYDRFYTLSDGRKAPNGFWEEKKSDPTNAAISILNTGTRPIRAKSTSNVFWSSCNGARKSAILL